MKRTHFGFAVLLGAGLMATLLAVAHAAHVGIASSPRGLYFEPATAKTQRSIEKGVAVRFWIELHPRDEKGTQTVTADHAFHNHDRMRFRVAANTACYAYVAYHSTTGQRALLFPSLQAGRDNHMRRHEAKAIPSTRGYFTFDDRPGTETLVVVVSPERVEELERMAAARVGDARSTDAIDLSTAENRLWSKLQAKWTGRPTGASTRNVAHEAETDGAQVGSYYAQTEAFTKPVVFNITLRHVP